ncbi:uncharacterized protein N7503_008064 [Penicillium pulvis]|uniref:uncharacterized protein n=1 Tax=Penicillium pulvis TaxID=1562058 RepID=UPI0025465FDC|nr:uncharacterized protein N7503_008064 [Penicillium pulvis]KAJ5792086.1 hypothetical protein N7503_008064 [Penicillium pulvis]
MPTAMPSLPQDLLDGISGALAAEGNVLQMVLVTFIALSCYNIAELVVLVTATFRRWRGLYFWSLLTSGCLGVIPYTIGFMMKFFTRADSVLSVTVLTVGWWTMVTGQSVVLYSRLHLVLRDEKTLTWVLRMIVLNFFLLEVPTTILTYGANVIHTGSLAWVWGYNVMEKVQLTGFTIQESLISTLYVIHTVKLLRLGADATSRSNSRTIMYHVIGINCTIMAMDLLLLSLEYANQYAVQIVLKGFIYSIKLKLEFAVLGRLVDIIQGSRHPISVAVADTLPLCSFPRLPESSSSSEQTDPEPESEPEPKDVIASPDGDVVETRDFVESRQSRRPVSWPCIE